MYVSFMSKCEKTFQVKTIKGEHTCCRVSNSQHCTSKFLAKKYETNIRSNPDWPAGSMQEIMQRDNKTSLSLWKMYRVKKHAAKSISGTEIEQYNNFGITLRKFIGLILILQLKLNVSMI
ncbi:hypothetical protein KSP39_PZI020570 [Platanthera zijinensis]|uniref:Uncharacterized protein n=1 Tax=Platanthera zijinensis TaxID=2320716 RepID=A0AAP0B0J6_9ASPA